MTSTTATTAAPQNSSLDQTETSEQLAAESQPNPTTDDAPNAPTSLTTPATATATTPTTPTPTTAATPSHIEFEPPAACIRRLLKHALPKSTNVAKDASSAFSRASGIFILYLTSCANDYAREGKRSTIIAKDVLNAVKELDFGEFGEKMEKFLEVHRKEELVKKREKERLKEENSASSVVDKTEGGDGGNDHDENIRKGDEEGEHSEGEKSPSHGKSFEEASTNDQDVEAVTGQSRSRDEKEVNDEDENEDEGGQPQAKKQKVVDENENDDNGNEEEEGDEDEE